MPRVSIWFWDAAFALVFGFLAVNTTVDGIQNWTVKKQLQCCSTATQAQVINRWEVKGGSYPTQSYQYHVSYSFDAPQLIAQDDERVDWKSYGSAIPGRPIAIQYVASDPTISRIKENAYQYPYWEMAALWWLLFPPTLWSLSLKLRRAHSAIS